MVDVNDDAQSQYFLVVVVVCSGFTIFLGGILYLFAPAISAAKEMQQQYNPNDVVTIHADDTTTSDNNDAIATDNSSGSAQPILLSIIIPAYEEEDRLPTMLDEAYSYLSKDDCKALQQFHHTTRCFPDPKSEQATASQPADCVVVEWILVSDGSKDRTVQVYEQFVKEKTRRRKNENKKNTLMTWRVIEFTKNSGKGAAVRAGMMAASGFYCLMVDADGATNFQAGLEAFSAELVSHFDSNDKRIRRNTNDTTTSSQEELQHDIPILLGSRAHMQQTHVSNNSCEGNDGTNAATRSTGAKRSFIRSLLMKAFHICVVVFVGTSDINDTQCGFKLFSNGIAHELFTILHLRRWAFDTELLYLATSSSYLLREVIVPWEEVDGSKLNTSPWNLAMVSIGMFRDMVCVRLCYMIGIWNTRQTTQQQSRSSRTSTTSATSGMKKQH